MMRKRIYDEETDAGKAMNYHLRRNLFDGLKAEGIESYNEEETDDTLQAFLDTASVSSIGALAYLQDSLNNTSPVGQLADSVQHIQQMIDTLYRIIDSINVMLADTAVLDSIMLTDSTYHSNLLLALSIANSFISDYDSIKTILLDSLYVNYPDRVSSLQSQNSSIAVTESYEVNEQSANDIYIRNFMLADSISVTEDDMSTLWDIASQCPDIQFNSIRILYRGL